MQAAVIQPKMENEGGALPPIPVGHGFKVGDRVEMPLFPKDDEIAQIKGTIVHIDIHVGKKHYKGLALLGDDNRYYEFHPEIARKL